MFSALFDANRSRKGHFSRGNRDGLVPEVMAKQAGVEAWLFLSFFSFWSLNHLYGERWRASRVERPTTVNSAKSTVREDRLATSVSPAQQKGTVEGLRGRLCRRAAESGLSAVPGWTATANKKNSPSPLRGSSYNRRCFSRSRWQGYELLTWPKKFWKTLCPSPVAVFLTVEEWPNKVPNAKVAKSVSRRGAERLFFIHG